MIEVFVVNILAFSMTHLLRFSVIVVSCAWEDIFQKILRSEHN